MLKTSRGMDPLLRRPFSIYEMLAPRRWIAARDHDPEQAHRQRDRSAVTTSKRARGSSASARSDVRSSRSIPRPRRGWWRGASAWRHSSSLAEALLARGDGDHPVLRRPPRRRPSLRGLVRASWRPAGALDRGRQPRHARAASPLPLDAALAAVPASRQVRLYVCGPTPMMRAVAEVAASHRPPVRGLARTGHGVRPWRLLQLRRPGARRRRQPASHPVLHRWPGVRRHPDRLGGAGALIMDLSVSLGSLTLPNPLIAASGCFGYGVEYADAVDLAGLGGVAVKGLFLAPREGHVPPRIVETPSGMLNAIGLQGIGVHRFVDEKLPELRRRRAHRVRQHLRHDGRRVRRARADPLGCRRGRTRSS